MEGPPPNDCCSICHGSFNVPCQANCSHWFCGNCIMLVWHHGSALHPCKCPLCRRMITLLVPGEASLRERHNSAVAEILEKVEKYNRYFGGQSNGLLQRLQDLPFLLRRLLREMTDPQRSLPLVIRARVYLAVNLWEDISPLLLSRLLIFLEVSMSDTYSTKISMETFLSAIYIFSPIDIIPEAILGIVGLLDDLLIALVCFLHVAAIYRSVLYYRHGGS